jgi:hypothetical protein
MHASVLPAIDSGEPVFSALAHASPTYHAVKSSLFGGFDQQLMDRHETDW